ncbi:MAG: hypothetical protein EPN48_04775 [Microbacteriaceae bacterium]|nr:MAG: hypothetical protein EPN48_04775 [Microbacteriaceae bacterium]
MLIHALADSHELAVVDGDGTLRRLPAVGYPRFPTACAGYGLAYVAIAAAASPWQVVIAITDEKFDILDILPGAAVFAPPVWSADGAKLLFVRGDSAAAEAVVWHREDGRTSGVFDAEGLRSATWDGDGRIVYSLGGSVYRKDDPGSPGIPIIPAAGGLLEFGSDDLYATVDQLCIGVSGTVAGVERWYRQGLAPSERIVVVDGTDYVRGPEGRYPQWRGGDRLFYTSTTGIPRSLVGADEPAAGPQAHSVCWSPEPELQQ